MEEVYDDHEIDLMKWPSDGSLPPTFEDLHQLSRGSTELVKNLSKDQITAFLATRTITCPTGQTVVEWVKNGYGYLPPPAIDKLPHKPSAEEIVVMRRFIAEQYHDALVEWLKSQIKINTDIAVNREEHYEAVNLLPSNIFPQDPFDAAAEMNESLAIADKYKNEGKALFPQENWDDPSLLHP